MQRFLVSGLAMLTSLAFSLQAQTDTIPSPAAADEGQSAPTIHYQPVTSFTNLGFINTRMRQDGFPKLKSNFGLSLEKGHSYYLWKPMNGRLGLGIDAVWTALNYTNYKINMLTQSGDMDNYSIHEMEVGLQAGLGVNFCITKHLGVHLSGRYFPCYSMLYDGDRFQGAFGNFGIASLSVNYRFIGLGIEARFGRAKYKNILDLDPEDYDLDYDEGAPIEGNKKIKTTFTGFCAFVVFHF